MPQLISSNPPREANFDSINTAIAYLSASDEVKAEVDTSSEPVTIMDVSRHKSVQTVRGYVRAAEAFKDHAGSSFL